MRLRRFGGPMLWVSLSLFAQTGRRPAPPLSQLAAPSSAPPASKSLFGFRDPARQARWDSIFLDVPDRALAAEHLRRLTSAPHWASSPEDYATALYVADRFRAAGLATEIVPYRVLLDRPTSLLIEAFDATGHRISTGPTPEQADPAPDPTGKPGTGDVLQNDPRILPGFNSSSPSGDVTAQAVYVNYGSQADFRRLAGLGVSVKGRIVLMRYGGDFRGVKVYLAQQYGARGVLIFSDPADDGSQSGGQTGSQSGGQSGGQSGSQTSPTYPRGIARPDSAVQRGSVQFLPIYPGDPQTPGVSSVPTLPDAQRIPLDKLQYVQPSIPVFSLSSTDAAPILKALSGPDAPSEWRGGLPITYRLGGAGLTVHMHLAQQASLRTIWDVIGKIPGADAASQWVIAGNHRDAWVYGAADPGSGTAAMLEAVHGLGVLLQRGWRPRRTIVVASWDAEEEGLIGSTEWAEGHTAELASAVAYFNTDVAVSGSTFIASAVPSLRQFLREITREVPSPTGGTVYARWKHDEDDLRGGRASASSVNPGASTLDVPHTGPEPHIGDLGSGSDYTPFLQHLGIPSTDIGSEGPFGVYHTVYDNWSWFTRFADPAFAYTQQQARIFGLEIIHMASADVLPYDFSVYGDEIRGYLEAARSRAVERGLNLDFTAASRAAERFAAAGQAIRARQTGPPADTARLNLALCLAERALLLPAGLPRRPWYRHSIYAPGEFTGYTAVVIPGVNEAISASDPTRGQTALAALAAALDRAASTLEMQPRLPGR